MSGVMLQRLKKDATTGRRRLVSIQNVSDNELKNLHRQKMESRSMESIKMIRSSGGLHKVDSCPIIAYMLAHSLGVDYNDPKEWRKFVKKFFPEFITTTMV